MDRSSLDVVTAAVLSRELRVSIDTAARRLADAILAGAPVVVVPASPRGGRPARGIPRAAWDAWVRGARLAA